MVGPRQLKGNFKLAVAGSAVVDVASYVSSMLLSTTRTSITVPAVLSTAQSSTVAGERSQSMTIRFHSDITAAAFWARLYSVIITDDSVADWEANWETGATSPDNPKFSGTKVLNNGLVLLSLDLGADVGALRQQTITLPLQGPATVAVA
jgi:hypothetical protein